MLFYERYQTIFPDAQFCQHLEPIQAIIYCGKLLIAQDRFLKKLIPALP